MHKIILPESKTSSLQPLLSRLFSLSLNLHILGLTYEEVDNQGNGCQYSKHCGKSCRYSVISSGNCHISRHGQCNGLIVIQNNGTGKLGYNRNPAQDCTGKNSVRHHRYRNLDKSLQLGRAET